MALTISNQKAGGLGSGRVYVPTETANLLSGNSGDVKPERRIVSQRTVPINGRNILERTWSDGTTDALDQGPVGGNASAQVQTNNAGSVQTTKAEPPKVQTNSNNVVQTTKPSEPPSPPAETIPPWMGMKIGSIVEQAKAEADRQIATGQFNPSALKSFIDGGANNFNSSAMTVVQREVANHTNRIVAAQQQLQQQQDEAQRIAQEKADRPRFKTVDEMSGGTSVNWSWLNKVNDMEWQQNKAVFFGGLDKAAVIRNAANGAYSREQINNFLKPGGVLNDLVRQYGGDSVSGDARVTGVDGGPMHIHGSPYVHADDPNGVGGGIGEPSGGYPKLDDGGSLPDDGRIRSKAISPDAGGGNRGSNGAPPVIGFGGVSLAEANAGNTDYKPVADNAPEPAPNPTPKVVQVQTNNANSVQTTVKPPLDDTVTPGGNSTDGTKPGFEVDKSGEGSSTVEEQIAAYVAQPNPYETPGLNGLNATENTLLNAEIAKIKADLQRAISAGNYDLSQVGANLRTGMSQQFQALVSDELRKARGLLQNKGTEAQQSGGTYKAPPPQDLTGDPDVDEDDTVFTPSPNPPDARVEAASVGVLEGRQVNLPGSVQSVETRPLDANGNPIVQGRDTRTQGTSQGTPGVQTATGFDPLAGNNTGQGPSDIDLQKTALNKGAMAGELDGKLLASLVSSGAMTQEEADILTALNDAALRRATGGGTTKVVKAGIDQTALANAIQTGMVTYGLTDVDMNQLLFEFADVFSGNVETWETELQNFFQTRKVEGPKPPSPEQIREERFNKLRGLLLKDPNGVINMDALFAEDPLLAKMLTAFMASGEYTNAAYTAGLSGGGNTQPGDAGGQPPGTVQVNEPGSVQGPGFEQPGGTTPLELPWKPGDPLPGEKGGTPGVGVPGPELPWKPGDPLPGEKGGTPGTGVPPQLPPGVIVPVDGTPPGNQPSPELPWQPGEPLPGEKKGTPGPSVPPQLPPGVTKPPGGVTPPVGGEPPKAPEQVKSELLNELTTEIQSVIKNLGFDSDSYKEDQLAAIDSEMEEARVRLARQFGIDPGGTKSGAAQRQFELLEGGYAQRKAELQRDIADRVERSRAQQLQGLTEVFRVAATTDLEQQRINQNSSQFQSTLEIQLRELGLNEIQVQAAVKKINSEIANNTRRTSAEIGQAWADVTGEVGTTSGKVTAGDLGIDVSKLSAADISSAFMPGQTSETGELIRQSFAALMGRAPTQQEVNAIMGGGSVSVDSMPTLKSRQLSAEITQQNMERIAKYDSIAESLKLDKDKFAETQEANDRNWAMTTGQVAEQFGLDQTQFTEAKYMLDGMNNTLFFDETLSAAEKTAKMQSNFSLVAAKFWPGNANALSAFREANSLFDRTIGNQQNAAARGMGIDAETYANAQRQVQQAEDRMLGVWGSLVSGVEENIQNPEETQRDPRFRSFVLTNVIGPLQGITDEPINADNYNEKLNALFEPENAETLESIRSALETQYSDYLFPDAALRRTLANAMLEFNNGGLLSFFSAVPRDWFTNIEDSQVKQSIMSLIGGAAGQGSVERQGSSLLGSLGRLAGAVGGAYVGFKTGGPAGVVPGAQAGVDIVGQ